MKPRKRDGTRVDPLSGGEENLPPEPLRTVPKGKKANATNALIPGTGKPVKDVRGRIAKRVVGT